MEVTCLILSVLTIHPSRQQFFWYERITMTCAGLDDSNDWTFKRNTSEVSTNCTGWGVANQSNCTIRNAYPTDTGQYWCESEKEQKCSNAVNISVPRRDVILHSPPLPVSVGDRVTLRCLYKAEDEKEATSDFPTKFYKDEVFFGTELSGVKTLYTVSLSDAGFYMCEHPTKGRSEQSWLYVKDAAEPDSPIMSTPRLLCSILLAVLYTIMFIVCVGIYRKWAKART